MFRLITAKATLLKVLAILGTVLPLSGCYLYVISTPGGYVESSSTFLDCGSGKVCEILVSHTGFNETFTAVANPGYEFRAWQGGDGFFCGEEASATCTLDLRGVSFVPGAETVVASERVGFIVPIFERLDSPYPEGVAVDGAANVVGAIFEEAYPDWIAFPAPFSEVGMANVRYMLQSHVTWPLPTYPMYFMGDECDPDGVYADPGAVTTWATYAMGPYAGGDYFVLVNSPGENVLVGSSMTGVGGGCVDIPDETRWLQEAIHAGTLEAVMPVTRSPGSPF